VKHSPSHDSEFKETTTADEPSMQLLVPELIINAEFNL
jgi:hypothetical protein